jgi:GBP family porin
MKKTLLAAALTGLFALSAHAQSSVTLYGVLDTGIVYSNNQGGHSNWQESSSSTENTVYGLKGSEDLGGGLHAIFKLENGFNLNKGTAYNTGDSFGEQAYVGLQSERYGTVTLGRQFDSVNDYLGPISSAGSTYGGNLSAHPFNNDNLAADSTSYNNTIKYTSSSYNGLTFGGMYSLSNSTGFANNRAYAFGTSYTNGGLSLAAAYLEMDNAGGGLAGAAATNPNGAVALGDGSANFVAARQRVWGAGGNYAFGPATVGVLWTHSQIDNMADVFTAGATNSGYSALNGGLRLDNFEVNARYALTPTLSVAGAYTFTNGSYGDGANSSSPKWNEVTLQTDYALSKRTDVYVEGIYDNVHGGGTSGVMSEAMIGTLTPSSTGTQIAATVGMRHQF